MDELNRILIAALKGEFAMKEPTMEEVLKLVEFDRSGDGHFFDGPENHQYVPYKEYVVFEVEEEQ